MADNDTLKLLDECNAGIKMGVLSIQDSLPSVQSSELKSILTKSMQQHQALGSETHELLNKLDHSGKEPSAMAKGMSWIKTNVMIKSNPSDSAVAGLITDGCNMGVKNLNKYLNDDPEAEQRSIEIVQRLINLEKKLALDISGYL